MTSFGIRDVVDVTIMDDSGIYGAARCEFPAWFAKTLTDAPCHELASLIEAADQRVPVASFNLYVQKEDATVGAAGHAVKLKRMTLRTSREKFYFRICECGA